MLTYKIFLASSAELEQDRIAFGDAVQELNDTLRAEGKDVYFTFYKWERDTESFTERRKQDVYNDNINNCNLFILLYHTRVGKYTEEEYDFSWNEFIEKNAPQIIVFKKTVEASKDESVKNFEAKIAGRDKQYSSSYVSYPELKNKFFAEIRKLFSKGILQQGSATLYNDGQSVPAHFMGREEELQLIQEKLNKGGSLMLINAEGGIGKTTLAAKYWEEAGKSYHYKAWLFCENGIVSELKKLAPALNVSLANMTEEEQLMMLKMAIEKISNNFLLVLDNANTPEHIKDFKKHFRGLQWHVLITSRCKWVLEKEQEYEITTLPPPVAKELFTSYYKENTPGFDALLDRLLTGIHYHTLLVEIFAKNMQQWAKRHYTLQDFLVQLETNGLFLDKRSFKIETDYDDNVKKIAAKTDDILNILYDFSLLSEEERYWLVTMALMPAIPHEFVFLCEVFKQDKDAFLVPDALAEKGWMGMEGDQYRISPVIQTITLVKNKATLVADSEMLVNSLNEKLKNDGIYLKYFNEAEPYINLVESIMKNLMDAPFYALSLLCFNSCVYYLSVGDLTGALSSAMQCSKISEALGDKNGLAISLEKLGGVYETMGELSEALKYYEEEIKLFEELHHAYPSDVSFKNGLAISLEKLGGVYETMGELSEALKYYEEGKRIGEELHHAYPSDVSFKNGLAISLEKLGGVYETMGELSEALKYYEEDIKLTEELHHAYPSDVSFKNGLAVSLSKLGGVYETMGELSEALKYYEERKRIGEELHQAYPSDVSFKNGLAVSLSKLGGVYETMGELSEALKYYEEEIKLFEELHHAYPSDVSFKNGLAISLSKLGGVYETMGELSEALKYYEEEIKLFEELHHAYPSDVSFKNGLAISFIKLAGIHKKQGDNTAAKENFTTAQVIWEQLKTAFPQYNEFKSNLQWVNNQLAEF